MVDDDINYGIRGLADPGYRTKEEIKKAELEKFYHDHIKNSKPPLVKPKAPEDPLDTLMIKSPYFSWGHTLPKLPKNKFGDTPGAKNKKINDWITRRPTTDQDIQNKEFWDAYNSDDGKKMLTYVNKYGGEGPVKYDEKGYPNKATPRQIGELAKRIDKQREMTGTFDEKKQKRIHHQLKELKKYSDDPKNYKSPDKFKYTSRVDELVKADKITDQLEEHPYVKHKAEQMEEIIQGGKSITLPMLDPNFKKEKAKKEEHRNNNKGVKKNDR